MAKRNPKLASAHQFSKLMSRFGLRTLEGADLVAQMLHVSRKLVQGMYTRGLRRNDYDLLELRLYARFKGPVTYGYIAATETEPARFVLKSKEAPQGGLDAGEGAENGSPSLEE